MVLVSSFACLDMSKCYSIDCGVGAVISNFVFSAGEAAIGSG